MTAAGAAPPPRPGRLIRMVCLASGLGGRPMRTVAFFCVGAGAAPGCGGAGILNYFPNFSKLIWKPAKTGIVSNSSRPSYHGHFFRQDFTGQPTMIPDWRAAAAVVNLRACQAQPSLKTLNRSSRYAGRFSRAATRAGMILMLGIILHATGTGNMVAGGVTDVGLFLNLFPTRIEDCFQKPRRIYPNRLRSKPWI